MRKPQLTLCCLAALGGLALSPSADAALIAYTFEGVASGSYDGSSFSSTAFIITIQADTTEVRPYFSTGKIVGRNSPVGSYEELGMTLDISGVGSFTMTDTDQLYAFFESESGYVGFGMNGGDVMSGWLPAEYDMVSELAPSSLSGGSFGIFNGADWEVSGGTASTINMNTWDDVTFSATLVPEPSAAALAMLGGLVALRRRRP